MSDGRSNSASQDANEATRGSAIKLIAEVSSRLLNLAMMVLLARGLGVDEFGAFGRLMVLALLLAEFAEIGIQATASRALVAGTLSLRAFVRARASIFATVVAIVLLAALSSAAWPAGITPAWLDLAVLVPLILYFALSGWGEFLGVALRCRGARVAEGVLLLVLRASALAFAGVGLAWSVSPAGLSWTLAVSPLLALVVGVWLLARYPAVPPGLDAPVSRVLREVLPLALYGGLLLLSPRVEFLVLGAMRGDRETGLFLTALNIFWPLAMVPSAVAAGAMPALTREALGGGAQVRRRTAATMALFAAPATVGLVLVAPALVPVIFGGEFAAAAAWVRILALALIPLFLNSLIAWALIAAGRAGLPPRLVVVRIVVAFVLALFLVPRFGSTGAASGIVIGELLLLLLGARACVAGRFAVPVVQPVLLALLASVPMALAVWPVRHNLYIALVVGVVSYAATLAAAWRLLPKALARRLWGQPAATE